MPNTLSLMHERYTRSGESQVPLGERCNMIRLWEHSSLRLDQLAVKRSEGDGPLATQVRLDLSAGHVTGWVSRLAEGSNYVIQFGSSAARILGTVFDISAEGVVKVLVGKVEVTYPGSGSPKTQWVLGLQSFDVRTGVLWAL